MSEIVPVHQRLPGWISEMIINMVHPNAAEPQTEYERGEVKRLAVFAWSIVHHYAPKDLR
jgi:hypothetical protein